MTMHLVTRHTRACNLAGFVTITMPAAPWEKGEPFQPRAKRKSPAPGLPSITRIRLLLEDGQPRTAREISETLGITDSTVRDRISRLCKAGTITRFPGKNASTAGLYVAAQSLEARILAALTEAGKPLRIRDLVARVRKRPKPIYAVLDEMLLTGKVVLRTEKVGGQPAKLWSLP